MRTIAESVTEIVSRSPYLEEALLQDLINLSSLARKIQPEIEKSTDKQVQNGAIVMALKRLVPTLENNVSSALPDIINKLGEIIVRSNLCDFTYKNSDSLMEGRIKLLHLINENKDSFFALSQGVYETNFVISNSYKAQAEEIFANEKLISIENDLSAVTLKLPPENVNVPGLYYFILKQIAWEGIPIIEIVSTTNEFTVIIADDYVDKIFSILKKLKINS